MGSNSVPHTERGILGRISSPSDAAQMDRERELKIIRRAYAKQVAAAAGVEDPRIEAAFAAVGIRLAERPSVTLHGGT